MIDILAKLLHNAYYLTAMMLFIIGFHTLLTHNNLIKKIMGMNIMDVAIFLFFVSIGFVKGGHAPIFEAGTAVSENVYVNPLPSALILTGIVVAVSITAFALALITKVYQHYGTLDAEEIMQVRSREL